jgi:hypothetical protein
VIFVLILVGIAIVSGLVTWLLHLIKARWIKYIPALIALVFSIIMIIMARSGAGEGMQDLGWIIFAILLLSVAVGGGITGIVLDLWQRKQNT